MIQGWYLWYVCGERVYRQAGDRQECICEGPGITSEFAHYPGGISGGYSK